MFVVGLSLAAAGCRSTGRVFVAPTFGAYGSRPADSTLLAPFAAETYRVLLVGDTGKPRTDGPDPLLDLLRAHAEAAGPNSATVFLGDNVYPDGLPPEGAPGRALAEARLRAQLAAVGEAPGRVIVIPGNHDWQNSGEGGLDQVRRQEAFVEAALGERGQFLPSNGFPGPVAVDLTDDLRLLAVDTEWWLGEHTRAEGRDPETGAVVDGDDSFLLDLSEAVQQAGDRQLLVVGHHPMVTNGNHAGVMPPEQHLFPLLRLNPSAYVPLPVIGSVVAAIKGTTGETHQDLAHPRYRVLRQAFAEIFAQHDGLVYASGHDHSLQYVPVQNGRSALHQIVSGSGSEAEYVGTEGAAFAASRRGFAVLTYYADGSARMEAVAVAPGRPMGERLFTTWLTRPPRTAMPAVAAAAAAPVLPDSAVAPVALQYASGGLLASAFVREGYRRAWATPVAAPVLDLGREAGGLTPLEMGGDSQTHSLRLAGADGRTYRLRSIEKFPTYQLRFGLSGPLAQNTASDVTSGMYPFSALVAARLSDAAGLYHTNPRLVYVPDDPRLGAFQNDFGGTLAFLEERPDTRAGIRPHFGNSARLVSPARLYRALDADADHRVDAPSYLRARLFDMLVGDWDRHRDQYRWASFAPGTLDPVLRGADSTRGIVYRPISLDRDHAFNDRDGFLFAFTRPFLPKIQGLQEGFGNIDGLTLNGREQDRRFLAPLDRAAWRREAEALQAALTDDALAAAVDAVPAGARPIDHDRLLGRLTARRDALVDAAMTFYDLLAETADVVGSQDAETYALTWQPDGALDLTVSARDADGPTGPILWRRTFLPGETREVRIWARGGDDR
ncbi:MAG TPA: metallophosphoesterase, partial [Rubricoccaceae bacterium]